jgi:ionotropic kainate glutamate receptor 2
MKFFPLFSLPGGLFDDNEDPTTEAAFRYAVTRVNEDKTVLSRTQLSYDIQHLPAMNSFLAARKGKQADPPAVARAFPPRLRATNDAIACQWNKACYGRIT